MGYILTGQNVDTTLTVRPGLLLSIGSEDGNYVVKDHVGTRFGYAPFLADALAGWAEQVEDILGMQGEKLGDPLLSEVRAYKQALSR